MLLLLAGFAASNAYSSDCTVGTAQVSEVYPRADALPENLLRFYIYFSEPMAREGISSSVSLLDNEGAPISGVFLEHRYDLWSPDGKRLTILFDPGRVKTGLIAHNRRGRALIPGDSYALHIDGAKDINGCDLAVSYTKIFEASEAYTTEVSLEQQQLALPAVGTMEALQIDFGREMDHLSMAYRIRVEDEEGRGIRGALDLIERERIWVFTPTEPWQKQDYRIAVNTALEDVAGNRLTGLFDQPPSQEELTAPPEKQYLFFSL